MSDVADRAQECMEVEEALRLRTPYQLPPGKPGDCKLCGEWSGRLVDGACAPCRDRFARMNL